MLVKFNIEEIEMEIILICIAVMFFNIAIDINSIAKSLEKIARNEKPPVRGAS